MKFSFQVSTLSAVLASSILLAACGGGSDGSSAAEGADVSATVKQQRKSRSTGPTQTASSPTAASSPASSSSVISITQAPYNADSTGKTDSTKAIQQALTVAAQNGSSVSIPAGTFVYSDVLNVNGIAVTGVGKASILKATNFNNQAVHLTGTGGSISNLSITSAAKTRLSPYQTAAIWIDGATNFTVQGVTISGSASVGIFNAGGQGGTIQNNTVQNTLADGITNTSGANGTVVTGNLVTGTADDGISVVSYSDEPIVQNITVKNNTITGQVSGRGMSVVGGSNITYTGNIVDNPDSGADMYIASESEFNCLGVANVTVTGNTFIDGGPSQGTVTIYNSQGSKYKITGVNLSGNQIVKPGFVAFQFVGNGVETGAIQNNTIYSSLGSSGVLDNSNTNSNMPVTGTTMKAITAYSTASATGGAGAQQ
jgi:hypothetical protein